MDNNIWTAKKIITEEVLKAGYKVDRVILFGSRARGDFEEGSDYDFLVIIDKKLSRDEDIELTWHIQRRLAVYMASDIIIKSSQRILQEKDDKGLISYYALKEGVYLG